LKIGNESYKLLQFHTHTPSEVAINGKRSDMVIHLVHANSNDELAVVSVLLELGEANSLVQKLWEVMPKTVMPPQQSEVQIDINQLLPENKAYYTHGGSLTTPPCTEGVKWIILKQPISLSSEQLAQYREIYPHNARPLQPILTRYVLSSD
jgi:carbonic anhydrase